MSYFQVHHYCFIFIIYFIIKTGSILSSDYFKMKTMSALLKLAPQKNVGEVNEEEAQEVVFIL